MEEDKKNEKKRSSLADMSMPQPAYTDPELGPMPEEPGLEEGDLVQDYVLPLKSLFTGGAKTVANMATKKTGSKILDSLMKKLPEGRKVSIPGTGSGPGESIVDYSKTNKIDQIGANPTIDYSKFPKPETTRLPEGPTYRYEGLQVLRKDRDKPTK